MKPELKIKHWEFLLAPHPDYGEVVLTGEVYNHPKHKDGEKIRTSVVVWTDYSTKAETLNTVYILIGRGV